MLAVIQTVGVAGEISIWPQTLEGVLGVIVLSLTITTIITGLAGRWLNGKITAAKSSVEGQLKTAQDNRDRDYADLLDDIDGLGGRVDAIEKTSSAQTARSTSIERKMDQTDYAIKGYDERMGRLEGMIESIGRAVERQRETNEKEIRAIHKAVADMTASVKVMEDVRQEIMNHMRGGNAH